MKGGWLPLPPHLHPPHLPPYHLPWVPMALTRSIHPAKKGIEKMTVTKTFPSLGWSLPLPPLRACFLIGPAICFSLFWIFLKLLQNVCFSILIFCRPWGLQGGLAAKWHWSGFSFESSFWQSKSNGSCWWWLTSDVKTAKQILWLYTLLFFILKIH